MATTENKVQFNIKNVYYAVMQTGGESPTWETPVHVPGAVNLSLEASGEVTPFHADGIVYYKSSSNNGYEGDLEMARFIDKMLQDVWGYKLEETDKTIIENVNVEPKSFALLFQIDGDADNDLYCLYNCAGTRPGIAAATSTETKDPQTQTSTISATPLDNGNVFARTTSETPENIREAWFTKVYVPGSVKSLMSKMEVTDGKNGKN